MIKKNACSHKLLLIFLQFLLSCNNQDNSTIQAGKDTSQKNNDPSKDKMKGQIIFFGNSLTAGYGVESSQSFPSIIQRKIDSLGLPYLIINAGLSGETTADGKNRIGWILQNKTDIFVLELGANDGLRGLPLAETGKNLQLIIDSVYQKYPDARIILTGMEVPPNMGKKYTTEFRALFKTLAETNNVLFIPFLLEGVGGEPDLNQQDGIHPNPEGHKIVAENVWKMLKDLLK